MKLSFILLLVNAVVFVRASNDWCYSGCADSPSHWGENFKHCNGNRQSPINIDTKRVKPGKDLKDFNLGNFTSTYAMKTLMNNGHTVECELEEGVVEVSGGGLNDNYSTVQFHFHWGREDLQHYPGSEHSIDGHRYPMEMHIVSLKKGLSMDKAKADPEGISVLGFFIDVMEENVSGKPEVWQNLSKFVESIKDSGQKVDLSLNISIQDLLLDVDLTKYYRYNGSLTTPTCDEAVVWTVFQQPIRISKDLILRFTQQTELRDIYRFQQALHNRSVYASANLGANTPLSGHDWCYADCDHSTSHWNQIPDVFCGKEAQSPININSHHAKYKPSLGHFSFYGFSDKGTMDYLTNNGHTVKAVLKSGKVEVGGGGLETIYSTLQFHFHWGNSSAQAHRSGSSDSPSDTESSGSEGSGGSGGDSADGSSSGGSEHTLDSRVYPMEMHIVSTRRDLSSPEAQKDGTDYAVLGFFIEETNDEDKPVSWKNFTDHLQMLQNKDSTIDLHKDISLDALLGNVDRTKFYRYKGSLTTPSCKEAVVWTIFKQPIKVSKNLVDKFPKATGLNNIFRPVQPLNGREVYTTVSSSPSSLLSLHLILLSLCATLWINQRW